jgi:hypothetical protein
MMMVPVLFRLDDCAIVSLLLFFVLLEGEAATTTSLASLEALRFLSD